MNVGTGVYTDSIWCSILSSIIGLMALFPAQTHIPAMFHAMLKAPFSDKLHLL